ncbi:uncharacterized protein LOC107362921 [Tetranychus urticae]|uniref:Uncharacterized protein n=1 Tax=Tetranychus urticae TaxID=32264 RepID=T1KCU1_TETUR|nr:uncharacterized protein LOC107362921 [Tetranychus urticae]
MELESNLNETSSSWTSNLTKKRVAFIGTGVLLATAISIIVVISVKSSSKAPLALSVFKDKMNLIKDEIKWISYSTDNYSLTDALPGSTGSVDKNSVYLCRAEQLAYLLPGTFDQTDALCKVAYIRVRTNRKFDLLVTRNPSRLVWEKESAIGLKESSGRLKIGAISGGYSNNEELSVARFDYHGYMALGDLSLKYKEARGPAAGFEQHSEYYDVLYVADYAL